ncbi:MAG: putative bifunctional diguanylate cyclase/phosphodiesterase [Rhodoferax sp.]
MPTHEAHPLASTPRVVVLGERRLRQILWALWTAMVLGAAISATRGAVFITLLQLAGIGALLVAYRFNECQRPQRATAIMLGTLVVLLSGLIAVSEGLYDEAVIAFPGLLVFAGMLGSTRLLGALLAGMVAMLGGIYGLDASGWLLHSPSPLGPGRLVNLLSILSVTAFFVGLLVRDLRRAMAHMEEKQQQLLESHARIEAMAHQDPLTALPNRALAHDRLEQMLAHGRRRQHMTAVLFLDLDDFKTINDSLGHAAGDALLCQVAQRLRQQLRDSDTVARLSGDEFLLLLGDLQGEEAITCAATKVLQQLAQPFTVQGMEVLVTASLGVAIAPRDGDSVDVLLKHADLAMYRAKDSGRNAFRFFDPGMNAAVVEHLHMAAGLRAAMRNGELLVHYQPQIDLRSGRIVGAEALVRWIHPTLGYIAPAKFVAVAERTGLINELGGWVLEQACRSARGWLDIGLGPLNVAVNVSPVQFRRDDIVRDVANALSRSGLPAHHLELELTESLLVADNEHVSTLLQHLRTAGVTFAIDDFGTGYSNLGYLQRFAVHRLKIDQSFVRAMTSSAPDEGIVRAIIEMAHCLQLEVVAEGVETPVVMERLRSFGCEFAQGYAWSPALEAGAFVAFVRRHQGPLASAAAA